MPADVRVGDIGTVVRITIVDENEEAMNLSTASSKLIYLRKPNRDVLTKTASFYTNGTDGILQYTAVTGDWSVAGHWAVEAKVVIGTATYNSEIGSFLVKGTVNS